MDHNLLDPCRTNNVISAPLKVFSMANLDVAQPSPLPQRHCRRGSHLKDGDEPIFPQRQNEGY